MINSSTYYFYPQQDTAKKASPVFEQPRLGFDDEESVKEEPKEERKEIKKKNPFASVTEEDLLNKKEKKKEKKKKATTGDSLVKKEEKKSSEKVTPKKEQDKGKEDIIYKPAEQQLPPKEELPKAIDTVEKKIVTTPVIPVEKVKPKGIMVPERRNYINQDGIFVLSLIIALLFGWINVFHRKRFSQVINAFFIARYINQLIREENSLLQRVFIMVSIIFILILSIFTYQSVNFYQIDLNTHNGFIIFMICALGVSLTYFVKLVVLNVVGFAFDEEKSTKEYFYNIFLINNFLGIILVPIILCLAYVPQLSKDLLIQIGISVYVLSLVYRVLRGMLIGWTNGHYSLFHIFLYFCTLEILPFLLMIKLLSGLLPK